MFPVSFFPPVYFPSNFWPEVGSKFAGHGGVQAGGDRRHQHDVLSFMFMDLVTQKEIAEEAEQTLMARLLIQKVNLLADRAFINQLNAQTAYTVLMGEL